MTIGTLVILSYIRMHWWRFLTDGAIVFLLQKTTPTLGLVPGMACMKESYYLRQRIIMLLHLIILKPLTEEM